MQLTGSTSEQNEPALLREPGQMIPIANLNVDCWHVCVPVVTSSVLDTYHLYPGNNITAMIVHVMLHSFRGMLEVLVFILCRDVPLNKWAAFGGLVFVFCFFFYIVFLQHSATQC